VYALSERIRSFIAFDLESDQVLNKLGHVQKLLVETGADLRPVAPQNIHVTMRFLGDISPPMVDKLHAIMKNVRFTPFTIQLKGIGVFPSLNYPRVVWAAITEGTEQIKSIFTQLEPQIRTLGFAADRYGFNPHLTIARVRSGKNKQNLAEFVTKKADYEFGTIQAKCLRLKRSQLSPKGPTYTTLREVCPEQKQP
jgi:RNA 2',3'-cyclic 3'-phosphodiesterase